MSSVKLPGKLGDPHMTIRTDPRADPRTIAALEANGLLDNEAFGNPLGPDPSYEEILKHLAEMDEFSEAYGNMLMGKLSPVEGVRRRTETIRGVDGNEIPLFIHEPIDARRPLPGVVHTHGGGMAFMSATNAIYVRWRDELAATGMIVVGVEFRNSSGKLGVHPFPAGLNDCASAMRWASDNAEALGASAFIVSGESGGGNLCLATALKAKREGWADRIAGVYSCCPAVAGQYLSPPPELTSLRENEGYMSSPQAIDFMVRAYDPKGQHTRNPLAWPYWAARDDLAGLPPHVVSVNELDFLRDEGLFYAEKLRAAGVPTRSRTIERTYHGADTELREAIPEIYDATIRDIHDFATSVCTKRTR